MKCTNVFTFLSNKYNNNNNSNSSSSISSISNFYLISPTQTFQSFCFKSEIGSFGIFPKKRENIGNKR